MGFVYEKLNQCLQAIREKTNFKPKVALVLGSGLGNYADTIQIECSISYDEIEGFPISTVQGHKGRFVFGYVEKVPVVIMQGRVHYYEGYSMEDVVLPIRLMKLLGAETLLLTNAAGGVNETFQVGDFMIITDQISSFVPSPLIGENIEQLGTRFPDMSHIYDVELQHTIKECGKQLQIPMKEGVYLQFTGPAYESPSEIRMAKILGADAVGMSTACEAIVANHMGMKIGGISFISNMASGIGKQPLSHEEVKLEADKKEKIFQQLVHNVISML